MTRNYREKFRLELCGTSGRDLRVEETLGEPLHGIWIHINPKTNLNFDFCKNIERTSERNPGRITSRNSGKNLGEIPKEVVRGNFSVEVSGTSGALSKNRGSYFCINFTKKNWHKLQKNLRRKSRKTFKFCKECLHNKSWFIESFLNKRFIQKLYNVTRAVMVRLDLLKFPNLSATILVRPNGNDLSNAH